jgi:hypothetical protein
MANGGVIRKTRCSALRANVARKSGGIAMRGHQNIGRRDAASATSALRATLASGVRRNIDATCWRRGGT